MVQAVELSSTNERLDVGTRVASSAFEGQGHLLSAATVTWTALEPVYSMDARYWSGEALIGASRLYFPVSFLTLSLFAIFVFLGRSFPYLSDGETSWLKWSHVLLAFAFLCTQFTNRRYGPEYAFAQILLSLALCVVVAAFSPVSIVGMLPAAAVPSAREIEAFVGAFMVSGYLSAIAFDVARGPRWWTAPLTSSYVSSLGFALLYYPLAYAGSGVSWYSHMSTHAGVLIAASVAGLFPYWLLRPLIKPLPGFGGY